MAFNVADPITLARALIALHAPPPVAVTRDNWERCRAAGYIPDHIDSWESFEVWVKNLIGKGGR